MRVRLAVVPILLLALCMATASCRAPEPAVTLTIVGIDGATWKVIDPMLERGELPNVAALIRRGVRADLRSRQPLVSPPVWTTIATGVPRARHGIRGFLDSFGQLVSSLGRKAPALWTLASRGGRRAAVLGWWATYPAESIDGVVVSDRTLKTRQKSLRRTSGEAALRGTQDDRLAWPSDVLETIDALIATPPPGGDDLQDFDVVATMRLEDATTVRSLLRLRESHGPFDLECILLRGVDPVSHHFWNLHEPDAPMYRPKDRPTPEELARTGDPVEAHYRFVDGLIGEILRASSDDHAIVLVSDHGFEAGYQGFRTGRRLVGRHSSPEAEVGIFVAAGRPFVAGARLAEATILDVAPTVLRVLDLPVAEDLAGRVIAEALDPAWLARHPQRSVAHYEGPPNDVRDPEAGSRAGGDDVLEEELRSLGYIE